MTSPGSIGVGVSVDAGDLSSEITKAVMTAMKSVIAETSKGVVDMEKVLAGIDTSGIGNVADAAAKAATEASASFDKIDTRKIAEEAQRAGSGIESGIKSGVDGAERAIDSLNSVGLDKLGASATDAKRKIGDIGGDVSDIESKASKAGERFGEWGGKLGGAAAGLVGITGAVDLVTDAISKADAGTMLQAQLDLSPEESAKAGKIAGELYASNYGDSVGEVTDSLGAVTSALGNFTDDSAETLSGLTANALDLSKAFGVDVAESAQSANNLIRQGLAKDGAEAFDLITAAMQRVPAAMRGELLPVIDEYGVNFASMGFDGEEAMGLIVNAAQGGAIAMDKAGDAVKEFGIRATDLGDKGAQEALTALGFSGQDMANKLLAGGDTAKQAFQEIVTGLQGIDDPAAQAAAATALFGTPLEDLSKDQIPGFLTGLSNSGSAMGDFAGSADELGDVLASGPSAKIGEFKRMLETGLTETLGKVSGFFLDNKAAAIALAGALGTIVVAYGVFRIAAVGQAVALGVSTAATGANTAALAGNKIAIGASVVAQAAMKAGQLAGAAATGVMTAAQWAFNAALSANPITLVVAAIAALVAGLTLFFTKTEVGKAVFETLKNAVVVAWDAIKVAFSVAWEFIQGVFSGIANFVTVTIPGAFNSFLGVVTSVWSSISGAIGTAWDFVVGIFNGIVNWFTVTLPNAFFALVGIVQGVWQGISDAISNAWNFVSGIFNAIVGFLGEVLAQAWENLRNNVAFVWQAISDAIGNAWNFVSGIFNSIVGFLADVLGVAFENLRAGVQAVWDGIGAAIGFVIDNVIKPAFEGLKSALGGVRDFFQNVVDGIGVVWDGMRSLLAKPINFLIGTVYNGGIVKAWNKIGEFIPLLGTASELPLIPEHRKGGPIGGQRGPIDKELIWATPEEHMLTVDEVQKAGGHNIVFAIRDMIARGIPFEWDNGRIISTLGRSNLSRYGAAVQSAGIGNASPEGLFDSLLGGLAKYKDGGRIGGGGRFGDGRPLEPWMEQLMNGHRAAKMRDGNPYTWGFEDCSGYLSMIADAIINGGDGVRRWATGSFPGGQPWVPGLGEGFSVGVHDNPGGPGGGHTAGTLSAVGPYPATNVESGGSHGYVAYGGPAVGADDPQWNGVYPGRYHLDIGANGFFQPGQGGGRVGPSPEEQKSFLHDKIKGVLDEIVNPIKSGIGAAIGVPPPKYLGIPPKFLDVSVEKVASAGAAAVEGLGDLLSSAWNGAKNLVSKINPFDHGGVASGKGMMRKDIIAPERILSPEQTRMFELLVKTLDTITTGGGALLDRGDYDGRLMQLGIPEDSPIVDAILQVRNATIATNDFLGRAGSLLTAPELPKAVENIAMGVDTLLSKGAYDPSLAAVGIEEGSPLVAAVLEVRDTAIDTNRLLGEAADIISPKSLVEAFTPVVDEVKSSLSTLAGDLVDATVVPAIDKTRDLTTPIDPTFLAPTQKQIDAQGALISDTQALVARTASSVEQVQAEQFRQLQSKVEEVTNRLTSGVLGPVVQSAMQNALGIIEKAVGASTDSITAAADGTTAAVKDLDVSGGGDKAAPPFGAPGSAFDFASAISDAVVSVANTASQALLQVGQDIAKAALSGKARPVDNPAGVLGDENNSGGFLVDTLVRLTGVEIQIRDFISGLRADVKAFRGDQFQAFDESGALLSDTASLMERTASSTELVVAEQNRINRELVKALLRYVMLNVIIPILTAMLTAIITLVSTAIGAVVGALLGPIGAAVGAAVGAVVGLALSAVGAAVIGGIGLAAGAGIEAFDSGGIANGMGVMPKRTIAPERVLSPQQTASFDRLVSILGSGGAEGGTNKTVQIGSMTISGSDPAGQTSDRLLSLLNS